MMILIALAAAAAAQPEPAPAGETQRIEISYADLNLTKREGAATLNRRVRGAATAICGGYDGAGLETLDVVGCRDDLVKAAQPQVAAAIERALARRGEVSVEAMLIRKR